MRMEEKSQKDDKYVWKGMMILIFIYSFFVQIIGILFFRKNLGAYSFGLWIGVGTALGMAVHMWRTLRIGLDLEMQACETYIRKQSFIRYICVVAVLILVIFLPIGDSGVRSILCFMGIMGLKAAAYLQPFVHKILRR